MIINRKDTLRWKMGMIFGIIRQGFATIGNGQAVV